MTALLTTGRSVRATSSPSVDSWSRAWSSASSPGSSSTPGWGTTPAFALVGTVLGIVAAGTGFWLRVRTFLRG